MKIGATNARRLGDEPIVRMKELNHPRSKRVSITPELDGTSYENDRGTERNRESWGHASILATAKDTALRRVVR